MPSIQTVLSTALLGFVLTGALSHAADDELLTVPFDTAHWDLERARVSEMDGRTIVVGTAYVKSAELANGVLEVAIKVGSDDVRSYPGFIFHMDSPADAERVYLRPHRAPLYADAVQYTPVFNGIAGWQLYAGDGATSATSIPIDTWFTLRLEIAGDRARVVVDDTPVLEVTELRHGARSGRFGLIGPPDGSAVFSDFRWAATDTLDLGPRTPEIAPPGAIRSWQLSSPIAFADVIPSRLPDLEALDWVAVEGERTGLVDIARHVAPAVPGPPTVIARTTVHADEARTLALRLGYSDRVTAFLDRRPVFRGLSDYRSRDSGFSGVVGPFDTVFLPLTRGDHEIALQVTETFGGWGFTCRDGGAVALDRGVGKVWEAQGLGMPESALFDPMRNVVYVSDFDGFRLGGQASQHLMRISMNGEVLDATWVGGLTNPTGLAWRGQEILAVERRAVAVIDPRSATVSRRVAIPDGRLLNDIAVAADGSAFVSDSRAGTIYRVSPDDRVEKWLELDSGLNPNGLCVVGGELFVGLNPVHRILVIKISDRGVADHAVLPPGQIDGIEDLGDGALAVSQSEGRLLRVRSDGVIEPIVDASELDDPFADIEVVGDAGLVLVPTYFTGRLVAYTLPE